MGSRDNPIKQREETVKQREIIFTKVFRRRAADRQVARMDTAHKKTDTQISINQDTLVPILSDQRIHRI